MHPVDWQCSKLPLHQWSLSSENSVHILSGYLWKLHIECSPGNSYMSNTRCMLSLWKPSAQTTDGSRLFCINRQDCWFPSQIFSEGVDILSRFDMCSLLLLWSLWNFFCLLKSRSFTLLIRQHTWSLWSIFVIWTKNQCFLMFHSKSMEEAVYKLFLLPSNLYFSTAFVPTWFKLDLNK